MENCKKDYYFTEKLIDCFRTKTIPIYWGCPSIGTFFDVNGILTFNTVEELKSILLNLTNEYYYSKIKSIEFNTPFDDSGYSGVDGSELKWDDHYFEDETMDEPEYIGPKVVLLNIGDV
jgi:hypothetical protein